MEDNHSFCSECGNKVEGKHKFCEKCGAELKAHSVQADAPRVNIKNNKNSIVIGLAITMILIIGISLFSYKSIFSAYYLSRANKAANFEVKAELLKTSMNYKISDANSTTFTKLIKSESKINSAEAEVALISTKDLINIDVFKNLYLGVESDKAFALITDHKYKEAAEAYAGCGKYDINIVNNADYIKALSEYADSELVKKSDTDGADISNYYSVGDIDKDGLLEVAVFERNFSLSSEVFTPNNIKLFKYSSEKYNLLNTVKTDAEYCININISKAKDDISGIFVAGGMGMHSGCQSLLIVKEGKLVSAIDKDIYSVYPSEIKDIDGDKMLELSSLEVDPNSVDSSNAGSSKILTWYKWNGKDALTTVKTQKIAN